MSSHPSPFCKNPDAHLQPSQAKKNPRRSPLEKKFAERYREFLPPAPFGPLANPPEASPSLGNLFRPPRFIPLFFRWRKPSASRLATQNAVRAWPGVSLITFLWKPSRATALQLPATRTSPAFPPLGFFRIRHLRNPPPAITVLVVEPGTKTNHPPSARA